MSQPWWLSGDPLPLVVMWAGREQPEADGCQLERPCALSVGSGPRNVSPFVSVAFWVGPETGMDGLLVKFPRSLLCSR